jgi:hypothetical protein
VTLGLEKIEKNLADIGNAHYGLGHGWAFLYRVNGRHWRLASDYRFPQQVWLGGLLSRCWTIKKASNLNKFGKKSRLNDNLVSFKRMINP